jgi:hypothetical protein
MHRAPGGRLAQNHFPRMRLVPKCSIFHVLSYETYFEKYDPGLFALRFYTRNMYIAVKKAEKC